MTQAVRRLFLLRRQLKPNNTPTHEPETLSSHPGGDYIGTNATGSRTLYTSISVHSLIFLAKGLCVTCLLLRIPELSQFLEQKQDYSTPSSKYFRYIVLPRE